MCKSTDSISPLEKAQLLECTIFHYGNNLFVDNFAKIKKGCEYDFSHSLGHQREGDVSAVKSTGGFYSVLRLNEIQQSQTHTQFLQEFQNLQSDNINKKNKDK